MPILLDDISSITNKMQRPNLPSYFSQQLTGRGPAPPPIHPKLPPPPPPPLINENFRPGRSLLGQSKSTMDVASINLKSKHSSSSVTTHTIPFGALTTFSTMDAVRNRMLIDVPSSTDRFHVTAHATTLDFDLYVDMTPQGAILSEDGSGDKMVRHLDVCYRMEVYVLQVGSTADRVQLHDGAPYPARIGDANGADIPVEFAMIDFSYAPLDDIEQMIKDASRALSPGGHGVYVDVTELATWMSNYNLYDRICQQADVWNSTVIGDLISEHIPTTFRAAAAGQSSQSGKPSNDTLNQLALQLRYLEKYNVPLSSYRKIYNTIRTACPQEMADIFTKQNLNLLMNGTLADLDA